MRFGFIVASLTVHAAVVGLAWRFAPVGERATPPRATPSGLPSDELEVTRWEPTDRDEVTPVVQTPETASEPEADTPRPATSTANVTSRVTSTPARDGAPPKTQSSQKPEPRVATTKPSTRASSKASADTADDSADKSPGDWISTRDWISTTDQLPDTEAQPPAAVAKNEPARDELVERLLAKERDKARLAARDEAERRAATQRAASAATEAPTTKSRSSEPETFGESRARADVWVEFTRWLPRAASNDRAWEQLPANTSYEFKVELVTEAGKLVSAKALDRAPTPTAKLLENTSHLMERGSYGGSKRTTHRFELRIRLSTTEPRDLWIAHTTPDPPKPGVGSFIAPSGRRFDVWVTKMD